MYESSGTQAVEYGRGKRPADVGNSVHISLHITVHRKQPYPLHNLLRLAPTSEETGIG
jgi:hypothetical protein